LLHNPKHCDRACPEDRSRQIMRKTIAWFEARELMRDQQAELGARAHAACPSIYHFAP